MQLMLGKNEKYALIIFTVAFLIYSNTLLNGFVTDDEFNIVENEDVKNFNIVNILTSNFWTFYSGNQTIRGYYTPVISLSFAIEHAAWGLNPAGYHLTNILIHAANGIILFYVLLKLTRKRNVSLISSLVFVTLPIQVETVSWISGRTFVFALFFTLLSFYSFIRYRETRENKYYAATLVFFGLGLLSKEAAIVLPLLLLGYDYFYRKTSLKKILVTKELITYLGLGVIAFLYAFSVIGISGGALPSLPQQTYHTSPYQDNWMVLLNIPLSIFYYILMISVKLTYYMPPYVIDSILDPVFFLSLAAFIPLLFAFRFRQKSSYAFFTCWFYVTMLIAIVGFFVYKIHLIERFSYIPSVAYAVIMPSILLFLLKKKLKRNYAELFGIAIILILVTSSVYVFARTFDWRDDKKLFESFERLNAGNYFMQKQLGDVYLERGYYSKAIEKYQDVLKLESDFPEVYNSLGIAYYEMKDYEKAMDYFSKAIELDPENSLFHNNIGNAYSKLGLYQNALKSYETALGIDPENKILRDNLIEFHNTLAFSYLSTSSFSEAIEEFKSMIELDPENADAYFNTGVAYLEGFDDIENAEQYVRKAIDIDPAEQKYQKALEIILDFK